MNQYKIRAEQSIQAVRDGWDRAFAEAKGQKHLIELLRMALRVEQLAHDLTRRTMEHTENSSESKSAIIRTLVPILNRHGIERPPLPVEMTVVTH